MEKVREMRARENKKMNNYVHGTQTNEFYTNSRGDYNGVPDLDLTQPSFFMMLDSQIM